MTSPARLPAAALASLSLLMAVPAIPSTIRVPGDQPTIQAGLDAASYGDTVLVACGTYFEHNIQMKSGVCLKSETGSSDCATIDAGGLGRGIYCSGVASTTTIDGFTITGAYLLQPSGGGINCDNHSAPTIVHCQFLGNEAAFGGGLSCHIGSAPTIRDCSFYRNTAAAGGALACFGDSDPLVIGCRFDENAVVSHDTGSGGAIHCTDSSPALTDCTFSANRSDHKAGALHCSYGSEPVLVRCTFLDNEARTAGGAIVAEQGTRMAVTDCLFSRNSTPGRGGAASLWLATASFQGCTFTDNEAGVSAGGAFIGPRFSSSEFVNCTFYGNSAPAGGGAHLFSPTEIVAVASFRNTIIAFGHSGGAVFMSGNSLVQLACCDVFGNGGGDYVGGIAGFLGINGNVSEDPLFCDAPGGNFRLAEGSPCAPEHSGGCGQIGDWPVGCGATTVEPTTWGAVKHAFSR